ncbi:MAG: hypothetical protein CMJ58_00280 [Planctomycetaceae bacterium]|nr:hypothetical protein [Planctomycetaceae bacterium]
MQDGDAYALAMYCGGLAVECLLRAFRWQEDQFFDGRHDLSDLLSASKILGINDDYMRRRGKTDEEIREAAMEFRSAMNEIVVLWHNNLRFASEKSLKAHLVRIHRVQGVKGDPLKKNASDLMDAVQRIVNRGFVLWDSQKKS